MNKMKVLVVVLACVGVLALTTWAGAGPGEKADKHPQVDGAWTPDACEVCHQETTPEIHAAWYESQHGKLSVKCFVCHGSTGEDFSKNPGMDRCVGCHADQVDTMGAEFMKDKTCFTCHPGHSLVAHTPMAAEGGEE